MGSLSDTWPGKASNIFIVPGIAKERLPGGITALEFIMRITVF
jgi:hypothetical protein